MRAIDYVVGDIRRKVFTEVARLAYEGGDYDRIEELPYRIVPGQIARYRESIFLERAIVEERLRLAIGLPLRPVAEHAPVSAGIHDSAIDTKYYDPPLVNIIKFACNACEEKYVVSDCCQSCLSHPCTEVCPKDAVSIQHKGKAIIDQDKCINCDRCRQACPYNAILKMERPCAVACGVDAIKSDEHGFADIDQDICVSCGMCIVNCPFGAISDKAQIFQLIHAMKKGENTIAIVAPSFVGQFGPRVTPERLTAAMKELGFSKVVEVAVGADLCSIQEAKDFVEEVPHKQPFMATSCCPSWSVMAKNEFPELASYISMALTPMVLTARMQKKENPGSRIVFIGPCASKKLEASRQSVRSDVDFVLTYEELMGMFEAKEIDLESVEGNDPFEESTAAGRNFAISGGVAQAVAGVIREIDPDREIKIVSAAGLRECKKMLTLASKGKYDGYLLEGMACPGGCVTGTGTLLPVAKAKFQVNQFAAKSDKAEAYESPYKESLDLLVEK